MAWTKNQKTTAVLACRAARMDDDARKLLLRQYSNSFFDAQGERTDDPTSTSKRLSNADFENFMAVVERAAGGTLPGGTRGYWERKAGDRLQRLRFRVRELADELEAAGLLAPGGVGLAGWITKRVNHGEPCELADLDYHGLLVLITGLNAHQRQSRKRSMEAA